MLYSWCKVPPIFSTSKIKHDILTERFILDQKRKGTHIHGLVALEDRLDESPCWHNDIGRGIDDGYFDR